MAHLNFKNSLSFLTVSEFSKNEISNFYNVNLNDIHVLYNGVNSNFKENISENSSLSKNKKPFALAVSSPSYHKNFSSLIEAFNKIDNPIELKIIGSSTNVFKDLENNKDNPKIKFLGRISDEELIELYQTAEFFIFPSLYEGFGIPPLEAQACGCPVISSNAASLPEVLGDSAFYFDPKNSNSIKDAIWKVLNDSSLRENLKNKGLDNVKRYSWRTSALELDSLLKKLEGKFHD